MLSFSPQAGQEQAGRRPALVLSPKAYNEVSGLLVCCPVTGRVRGSEIEVVIAKGGSVSDVVLADQIRSLDWAERKAEFKARADKALVDEVKQIVKTLLSLD